MGKGPLVHLEAAPVGSRVRPFCEWAKEWYAAAAAEVAEGSGGRCGVLQSSVLATAAAALAWERYALTLAAEKGEMGLAKVALSFGESARKCMLTLKELKGEAAGPFDPLADPSKGEAPVDGSKRVQREMRRSFRDIDRRASASPAWGMEPEPNLASLFGTDE